MLTVGSLFAGIGGFDLGFERAGMRTLWFAEQDPFCQRVLAKHWPGVPCHSDVRALVADTSGLGQRRTPVTNGTAQIAGRGCGAVPVPVPYVDVLCGGFPCQDISLAGRGAGLAGERSGLWREFARLIGELRPRYVVIENVPALTSRGLDVVLADLAACGLDAEWDHLPASALGAPHRRDRIWLIAYPGGDELREQPGRRGGQGRAGQALAGVDGETRAVAYPERSGSQGTEPARSQAGMRRRSADASPALGDPDAERRDGRPGQLGQGRRGEPSDPGWWLAEPDVRRVATRVPQRVDRLRALGNSLVPQIAEWIGRRIVEWERDMRAAA